MERYSEPSSIPNERYKVATDYGYLLQPPRFCLQDTKANADPKPIFLLVLEANWQNYNTTAIHSVWLKGTDRRDNAGLRQTYMSKRKLESGTYVLLSSSAKGHYIIEPENAVKAKAQIKERLETEERALTAVPAPLFGSRPSQSKPITPKLIAVRPGLAVGGPSTSSLPAKQQAPPAPEQLPLPPFGNFGQTPAVVLTAPPCSLATAALSAPMPVKPMRMQLPLKSGSRTPPVSRAIPPLVVAQPRPPSADAPMASLPVRVKQERPPTKQLPLPAFASLSTRATGLPTIPKHGLAATASPAPQQFGQPLRPYPSTHRSSINNLAPAPLQIKREASPSVSPQRRPYTPDVSRKARPISGLLEVPGLQSGALNAGVRKPTNKATGQRTRSLSPAALQEIDKQKRGGFDTEPTEVSQFRGRTGQLDFQHKRALSTGPPVSFVSMKDLVL